MRSRKTVWPIIILVMFLLITAGCASFPADRESDYGPGSVLVLPPRNVVQNGKPHARGEESGQLLLDYVTRALERTQFNPKTTSNHAFTNETIAAKEDALAEARSMKANYYLQLVLGEFQDAAPMTFRPDFVYLEDAILYSADSGKAVWRLSKPVYYQKENLGSYTPLLQIMSKQVVKSMTR